MAYNPATGNYDPDTNDFSSWYNTAGQQQQAQQQSNQGMDYITGTTDQPQQQQPMDPNSPEFLAWLQSHSGLPTTPNPYSDNSGVPITNQGQHPNGVDFSSPTTVPSLTASLPPPVVGTGNPGNDRNNPPGPDYFWSGTANHWVDPTGKHDATGRELTTGEQDYWHQFDVTRASNTARGIPTAVPPPPGPNQLPANGQAAPVAATPAAATATATSPYDYSKWQSVPGYTFEKNVFADSNAKQSFLELQGVMTPDQLQKASQLYGWQKAVDSVSPDANTVYANAIAQAKADPNSDYSIVRVAMPDGSVGYGVLKRENGGGNVAAMQQAQTARGFISPAVAIAMAQAHAAANAQRSSYGSGGGGSSKGYSSGGYSNGGGSGGGGGGSGLTAEQIAKQKAMGGAIGSLAGGLYKGAANLPKPGTTPPNTPIQNPPQMKGGGNGVVGGIGSWLEQAARAAKNLPPPTPGTAPTAGGMAGIVNNIIHPAEGTVISDGRGGSLVYINGNWVPGQG